MDMFRSNRGFGSQARDLASNLRDNWSRYMDRDYRSYRDSDSNGFSFGAFATGLALGIGIALLVAPKSGRELRDDLSRRAGELGENVRNRLPQMMDRDNETDRYASSGRKTGQPTTTTNQNPVT